MRLETSKRQATLVSIEAAVPYLPSHSLRLFSLARAHLLTVSDAVNLSEMLYPNKVSCFFYESERKSIRVSELIKRLNEF